jgi:endonuclease/exonuclease/phosphatase family metal-dependent hydrolase
MRLVSYNIQFGFGKDGKNDLARIAGEVRGADVIALQEVERHWQRTGYADQPAEIAKLLPEYHWVYGPGADMDASIPGPDGKPLHRRRQFGNMLLSKTPIITSRTHLLPKYATTSPIQYSLQRCALEGVINTAAGALRVYSIHLTHLSDETRAPQVERILEIHARAYSEGGAWSGGHSSPGAGWTEGGEPPMPREAVLMGDFNFPPSSPLYEKLVGPYSLEYGRMTHRDGFVDAWVAAGHAEHEGLTCDSPNLSSGKRIDFCYVSASLRQRIKSARIDNDAQGSDHQPIWTELDL